MRKTASDAPSMGTKRRACSRPSRRRKPISPEADRRDPLGAEGGRSRTCVATSQSVTGYRHGFKTLTSGRRRLIAVPGECLSTAISSESGIGIRRLSWKEGRVMVDNAKRRARPSRIGIPRLRLGAVIALAIAGGVLAWVLVSQDDDSTPSAEAPQPASPSAAPQITTRVRERTPAQLRAFARSLDHAIYWVGPLPRAKYELTTRSDGTIYIRYLPTSAKIGVQRPFLTVATYPYRRAFSGLQTIARRDRANAIRLDGGGIALVNDGYPQSIHVAFRGIENYQVELFDPSPQRARNLVASSRVIPIR
jgi:hypothetical protein